MKETFLLEKRLWEALWASPNESRSGHVRHQCMDQMSVHYKALVFQLIYLSTYYMQGDGCFGPTKGRTFQMGIIPSSCSVGG